MIFVRVDPTAHCILSDVRTLSLTFRSHFNAVPCDRTAVMRHISRNLWIVLPSPCSLLCQNMAKILPAPHQDASRTRGRHPGRGDMSLFFDAGCLVSVTVGVEDLVFHGGRGKTRIRTSCRGENQNFFPHLLSTAEKCTSHITWTSTPGRYSNRTTLLQNWMKTKLRKERHPRNCT